MHNLEHNYEIAVSHTAVSQGAATVYSTTPFNAGDYLDAAFVVNCGTIASGRSLTLTLQYSSAADFGSDVNDDAVGVSGNTAAVTAVAGINTLYFVAPVYPAKPYIRLKAVVAGGAIVFGATFIGRAKTTPA